MLSQRNKNILLFNNLKIYPYIKYTILKQFFKKKKKFKNIRLYKLSLKIFNFFKRKNKVFVLYNGKKFISFNFTKLKIFLVIGEFITTRIINSGKLLHKRKKK